MCELYVYQMKDISFTETYRQTFISDPFLFFAIHSSSGYYFLALKLVET